MSPRLLPLLVVPVLLAAVVGVAGAASWLAAGTAPAATPVTVEAGQPPSAVPASASAAGDANRIFVPPAAQTTDAPASAEADGAPQPQEATAPPPDYDVVAVQRRLTELGYYIADVDGQHGSATHHALVAFQKVQGLSPDGAVGADTLAALENPAPPALRDGPADRIEVDLDRQVLHLVIAGEHQRTMPASSGNGATYTTASGGKARSLTPAGAFRIERRIRGVRKAPLGTLFDPLYFYRGWAIHGSNSVPAHPASHGCVRIPRADAVWLFERAPKGMTVFLYGGEHTFPAGSPEPGTDTPAGDLDGEAQASDQSSPESEPPPGSEPQREPSQPDSGGEPGPESDPQREPEAEPESEPDSEDRPGPGSSDPAPPALPGAGNGG